MNLSSQRIWCYLCESEVFLNSTHRRNSIISSDSSETTSRYSNTEKLIMYDKGGGGESCDSSGPDDDEADRSHLNGLVGLQNIANTCYMNAALQALSNSPPLTGYFLDCGAILEANNDLMCNQSNRSKPGIAKSYHRLIREMWCKNRRNNGYVVPSGILYGIRIVHPMFRGFQQHDTQEFLRCFMDQLHEELKEMTPPPPELPFSNDGLFFDFFLRDSINDSNFFQTIHLPARRHHHHNRKLNMKLVIAVSLNSPVYLMTIFQ